MYDIKTSLTFAAKALRLTLEILEMSTSRGPARVVYRLGVNVIKHFSSSMMPLLNTIVFVQGKLLKPCQEGQEPRSSGAPLG